MSLGAKERKAGGGGGLHFGELCASAALKLISAYPGTFTSHVCVIFL